MLIRTDHEMTYIKSYWKFNFPMNLYVRLLVGRFVGWIGCAVNHEEVVCRDVNAPEKGK